MCDWLDDCLVISVGRLAREAASSEAMLDSAMPLHVVLQVVGVGVRARRSWLRAAPRVAALSSRVELRASGGSALTVRDSAGAHGAQLPGLVRCGWYSVCHVGSNYVRLFRHGRCKAVSCLTCAACCFRLPVSGGLCNVTRRNICRLLQRASYLTDPLLRCYLRKYMVILCESR